MIRFLALATWDPEVEGRPPLACALIGVCDSEQEAVEVAGLLGFRVLRGWIRGTWLACKEVMLRGPEAPPSPLPAALELLAVPGRHGLEYEWTDDWFPGIGLGDQVERNTYRTQNEFLEAMKSLGG